MYLCAFKYYYTSADNGKSFFYVETFSLKYIHLKFALLISDIRRICHWKRRSVESKDEEGSTRWPEGRAQEIGRIEQVLGKIGPLVFGSAATTFGGGGRQKDLSFACPLILWLRKTYSCVDTCLQYFTDRHDPMQTYYMLIRKSA